MFDYLETAANLGSNIMSGFSQGGWHFDASSLAIGIDNIQSHHPLLGAIGGTVGGIFGIIGSIFAGKGGTGNMDLLARNAHHTQSHSIG